MQVIAAAAMPNVSPHKKWLHGVAVVVKFYINFFFLDFET